MAANLVPLNEVIDGLDFIDNSMAYGHHLNKSKKRYLGINGITELNLDVARSIKGKKLPMLPNQTIELPDDYMDYVGIFILGKNNELLPLGLNNQINISNEPLLDHNGNPILDHEGQPIYTNRDTTNLSGSNNILSTGHRTDLRFYPIRTYHGNYGRGGGLNDNGYYRVDYEGNTIQFDVRSEVEEIYLEYISNGLTDVKTENIMVPVQVVEALRAYIIWKSVSNQRGVTLGEKMMLKREWKEARRLARARMTKFLIEEAKQSSRVWSTQTPRF